VSEVESATVGDLDEARRAIRVYGRSRRTSGIGTCISPTTCSRRSSRRVAADHYVYALTDYTEADYSIALARYAAAGSDVTGSSVPQFVPGPKKKG